ncbi:UDP-glucose--hexose-1-phosphate uridylyltransferase [Anaerostipes sp.]|uniref:UDP-glucose--hexose-1-phosphate uridylyltransferase n=1 Tax=Anaerostipes sp. TaxID=1872530 RepID=UPI0025BC617E|nr:UDP-glucose--hexose-1-phosphate uridylyltransferase [Anaerostipes sp.]MBS7007638.1 UDP-glucose--hexose-1-phosphate uridylyltransferase [Anaerostipes sp.]
MINENIAKLVQYGIEKKLIEPEDRTYTINQYLEIFHLDDYEEPEAPFSETDLEKVLNELTDAAYDRYIIKSNDIVTRDLFDTKLMGILVPKPSQVIRDFREKYKKSPRAATEFFYRFSQDTDYIRRYRVKKDWKWTVESPYGTIDITVNLSKPEKDPKAIAAAKNAVQSSYPKCQLCMENEGYAGRMNHPARQNHRIIPVTVNGSRWGFQYSPYVYYNEHCIVFNGEHVPMKIDRTAFVKLFDFVQQFPHYFLGSNADLPIVGGSILTHDHFQGGHYQFAMAKAEIEKHYTIRGFEDVEAGILNWPLSVLRIRSKDQERLIDLADYILRVWRGYTDEDAHIYAETDGEPHNTITPIARKTGDTFELDLTLRNNITTGEHPLGLFHPHEQYHHIKKENIGLIEVMGLAVLPSRLKQEMELLADCLVTGEPLRDHESLIKHVDWAEQFVSKYKEIHKDNVMDILKEEIGQVFVKVLENAGVYKCTKKGREQFERFIFTLNQNEERRNEE